jgi:prephenate dehydrogenase
MAIARGVLGEDDCLLREILFNPRTSGQVSKIRDELKELLAIIDHKDEEGLNAYLTKIREHIK